ncbi:MAG: anti-sigma factor [Bryobacteraceae bacterium]
MNCEELRDSFELYALGLLEDGNEKDEIRSHLERGCSACEANMKDALAVQALMLSQAPEVVPPARLKRRVMGAVGVQPMGWTWFAAACAAAMLMLALWFNVVAGERGRQLAQVRENLAETEAERTRLEAVFRFLEEPETKQVNFGTPQAQPPRGNVYLHPRLGVLLIATNLPQLTPAQAYEMWILPKDGSAPRPAGLFQSNQAGSAVHTLPQAVNLGDVGGIAVTVEPAAGSQVPTMPLVFAAQIG